MTLDGLDGQPGARAEGEPPRTRIVVLWDGGVCTYFLAPNATAIIGRATDCEMVVGIPSVSRHHAKLTGGDPPRVEDLGSMHGVKVRGQRIAPGTAVPVTGGESIELGEALVVIDAPRSAPQELAGPPSARSLALRAAGETPMKAVDRLVDVVGRNDIAVLILGEAGSGKSYAAQVIHDRSARARRPFVRIDCSAVDAFSSERPFAAAAGGTVLLDEIGEMTPEAQARLAAALAGPDAKAVRLLTTTQRDLLARVSEGAFRADVYDRVNGVSITLPPLRERVDEIPALAERFLAEACARAGRPRLGLTIDAMGALRRHSFFGNLRELRNTMERASVLAQAQRDVGAEHLFFEAPPKGQSHWMATEPVAFAPQAISPAPILRRPPPAARLWDESDDVQRDRITRALDECQGNQTRAAELLGISRRALIARIEEYGLPRPRKR
ncbi:MAG: sigma 54-interacting transcriptional regulator [Labilithrix sp.]|nr:sigma 54-interacting transcriptional regulator [Labilithrix sp.]